MFNREREMLKRFGDLHEHIIALLATFTQKGSHYLLFPWAECDLFDFWKNTTPRHDHETVLWIAEQCLQLVNALHEIHYVRKTPDLKRFGRHGDIKSENVLVFPNPAGGSGHGKLVLADMGCSSVHREISISAMSNNRVQSTLQYRPPECDIRGAKITRAFDIWTLGCLLLDMCTWWLGGWDLIEEFKLERFERDKVVDYKTGPKSDVYFEMRRYENSEDEHILVKESVTEVGSMSPPNGDEKPSFD
jgi:serine/threonine protein kinase